MGNVIIDTIFVFLAGSTVISGFLVVLFRNLLHAAVALFFCLCGVAGLYVMLGADFLGVVQLLVYAGGILVLIIFGIFLTSKIPHTAPESSNRRKVWMVAFLTSVLMFLLIMIVIANVGGMTDKRMAVATTQDIGELLLTRYVLPFELVSVLLLFALIGAVLLVRKEVGETHDC